jgi:hypothetical protein
MMEPKAADSPTAAPAMEPEQAPGWARELAQGPEQAPGWALAQGPEQVLERGPASALALEQEPAAAVTDSAADLYPIQPRHCRNIPRAESTQPTLPPQQAAVADLPPPHPRRTIHATS